MTDKKETKEKQKEEKETKKEKPKPASAKATAGKEEKKVEDKKVSKKETNFKIDVDEMLAAGVHFGHRTSRLHPKMEPYLAGVKNTVHIIDLEKTVKKFEEALKFIQELISENKVLLLTGTKIQIKDLVKEIAEECALPYVNERWLGGTLTNFGVLSKRVEYLKEIEKKKAGGGWEKYTKKERIKMNRELQNMKTKFEGLKKLEWVPDAIFVLDIRKDDLAVKEARMKGIKVIAICDTNVDPTLVDYPIPGNDDAISSVKYILEKVKETILKTKK
ncbi:30S ribosomal protein S2 [Candidatus Parcubacteria bacterium]|nr:30S ribosomal protein S2 [Candidatus Parcubacteria bacterium]